MCQGERGAIRKKDPSSTIFSWLVWAGPIVACFWRKAKKKAKEAKEKEEAKKKKEEAKKEKCPR